MMANKKTFTKLILLFIVFCGSVFANEMSGQSLYQNMKNAQEKLYPKSFKSEVRGDLIDRQIATIPSNYHNGGKPKLIFIYNKNSSYSFELQNVTSFYANMFSVFEPILETVGIYSPTTSLKTYSSFSKLYDVISVSDKGNIVVAKVRPEKEDKDYSIEYKINKDTFLIESCVYYRNSNVLYTVEVSYQNFGENYIIPQKIVYKSKDGQVNSFIEFTNPKTN